MKHKPSLIVLILTSLLLLSTAIPTVQAQSSTNFDINRYVIGSGGMESGSANYRVNGTMGQSIASPPAASSASFVLSSGYWFVNTRITLYLPAVLKSQ